MTTLSDIVSQSFDAPCRHGADIAGTRMPVQRITKRVVDAAKPQPATYLVRDTELKGFVLVVTSYGGKSYAVDYRAGRGRGGRKRRMTIGKHGSPWTPETARREALRLLADVSKGNDPLEQRGVELSRKTLAEICDLYFSEGVSHKKATTLRADLKPDRNSSETSFGQTTH